MLELPRNHAQRFALSNEVHARPPVPLQTPMKVSCIALTTDGPYKEEDRATISELTKQYGATPPGPGVKHYSVDLGEFSLIWERHTEFIRYTFLVPGDGPPFEGTALEAVPSSWLASLPGELIAGAHAAILKSPPPDARLEEIRKHFASDTLIGADIAEGSATAVTDFRIHADGLGRFLVLNDGMTQWHAGRIVQRLLEIETYRVMALLALPVAQALTIELARWENELSEITGEMTEREGPEETELLERLTSLQAAIERSSTQSQFRFGAGAAYYALVQRRISELREARMPDMQTFQEFTERRLAPAMATCASAERRLTTLSARVDRATQLLSTRVNLSLEQQNQEVLASMDRRVELQLRLQQTVEGLSVAAITYYVVSVIGYMAKGAEAAGASVNPTIITGIAAPVVLAIAALGVRLMRKHVSALNRPPER